MNEYPEVVAKIANNYLERVKLQLRLVPALERDEFLREIQSHIYEAYMQMPAGDDVANILAVLAKIGEPAEVVADRLPGAMVRSGKKRNLPLYILGGILLAMFGIPLGFWGFGVLLGLLGALAGLLFAFYAVAGTLMLSGTIMMLCGLIRIVAPEMWDRLVALGIISIQGPVGELFQRLSPSDGGLILIAFAAVFIASGWGLLRLGKTLLRGLRFLFHLILDRVRKFTQSVRRRLRNGDFGVKGEQETAPFSHGSVEV